jgi:hypothetical protein
MDITHVKVSAKSDNADTTRVQPSDWNASHSVPSIVDADVSATAEIAVSKLADGADYQVLRTNSAGTGVEWGARIIASATEPTNKTTGDIWLDIS